MPIRIRRCRDKPRTERKKTNMKAITCLWQSLQWRVMRINLIIVKHEDQ